MTQVRIDWLELHQFRNCEQRKLEFTSREVVLCGQNGVGKSNILEAIHFLSILRSFRTASVRDLVRIGAKGFRITGRIRKQDYPETLEVEQWHGNRRHLRIDGVSVPKSSEFIREFRAVAFTPEDREITAGGSSYRRRFFDMYLSVTAPDYLTALQRYGAALARRNAVLRNPAANLAIAAAFEQELAESAAILLPARRQCAETICTKVNELLGTPRLRTVYRSDSPDSVSDYLARLSNDRERERKRGCTGFGPQTDDFIFYLDGKPLREFGSNGQLRLTALYLKMAAFALLRHNGTPVVALVDDVTGELDEQARNCFFDLLKSADQAFYTFTAAPGPGDPLHQAQVISLP